MYLAIKAAKVIGRRISSGWRPTMSIPPVTEMLPSGLYLYQPGTIHFAE